MLSMPQVELTRLDDFLGGFDKSLEFDKYLDDNPDQLPAGERLVKFAGQLCYLSHGAKRSWNKDAQKYLDHILSSGHGCYDAETEVLTSVGWKDWPSVTERDFLATLKLDRSLTYAQPLKVASFQYAGRMCRVETAGVDLLVTPNHQMYVCPTTTREGRKRENFRLVTAEELGTVSHAYSKVAETWSPCNPINYSHNVMRFLGFTIGDGYYAGRGYQVKFRLRRPRKIVWLRALIQTLSNETEGQWELQEGKDDRFTINFPSCHADLFQRIYLTTGDKCIPQHLLMTGTRPALTALLEGLMQADGSVGRTGNSYDTTSPFLVGQLQQLCLHTGIAANVCYTYGPEQRTSSFGTKPLTRLWLVSRQLHPEVNKYSGQLGRSYWIDDWAGEVFCAQMPDDTQHVLYVRRNGQPVWCGNSVLEHANYSFLFYGISRSMTHELVRHRAGFAYCLAGNTVVFSGSKFHGKLNGVKKHWTMKQLYDWSLDKKRRGRLKLLTVRCWDGESFVPTRIKGVSCSGEKEVFDVQLADDKVIRCSADHRFLGRAGWKALRDFQPGEEIATNGLPLYQSEVRVLTVKWVPIVSISTAGIEMTYDLEVDHPAHNFVANGIVTHNSQVSQRYVDGTKLRFVERPEYCNSPTLHHMFEEWIDSCKQCYDIRAAELTATMKDTFTPEMTAVDRRKAVNQAARSVLPNETEAPIVVTANVRAWRHFLEMRASKFAEVEIRRLAYGVYRCLLEVAPMFFSDYTTVTLPDGYAALDTPYHKV
jgi:thymidylate synthase ThyX